MSMKVEVVFIDFNKDSKKWKFSKVKLFLQQQPAPSGNTLPDGWMLWITFNF